MWGDPNEVQPEHEKGDRYSLEEAWNRRLIVRPMEYIPDMPLRETRGDAIKVNVVNLDDPNGPRLYKGALWFSGPIIKTFKHKIGIPFIGYPTKEPVPNSSYKRWVFVSLVGDQATEAAAQAWIAANPEFMAPIEQPDREVWGNAPDTSHHERGPAPDWAGAVPARPAGPPPMPQQIAAPPPPPAPPAAPVGFPAPVSPAAPPAPAAVDSGLMDRLRRQAEQPFPPSAGTTEQPPPF